MTRPPDQAFGAAAMRHALNPFDDQARAFYAFVTDYEGADDEVLYIRLECVEKSWMDRVWDELRKILGDDFAAYFALINGAKFERFYPALTIVQLNVFFAVYFWFLKRVIDNGQHYAPVSIFELVLQVGDPLRDGLLETDWYTLLLRDDPETQRGDDTFVEGHRLLRSGSHFELGFIPDEDREEAVRWMARFTLVADQSKGALTQGALKALHFPLPAPPWPEEDEGGSDDGGEGPGPRDDYFAREPSPALKRNRPEISIPVFRGIAARVRHLLDAARDGVLLAAEELADFFDDLRPPPAPAFAFAGAGAPWTGAPRRRSEDRPRRRPYGPPVAAYIGSGAANPMDSTNAPQAPFVGILNIGQGGCSALYDRNGHVTVYYDFGSPAVGQNRTTPIIDGHDANPCLCNGPTIILSHWDMDHCDLGRFYPRSFECRWLAPQQNMGSFTCRDTVARAVHHGGQFFIWTATGTPGGVGSPGSGALPGGSHMRFPWGFVERCRRPGQNPNAASADARNNSGLAAYVCIRDAAIPAVVAPSALRQRTRRTTGIRGGRR